eukprot:gb/GECG01014387.1/.p1 GENE.gb/GECG01014387.1/~~gb/GECG01014387.1/.p1  ORF type:complete len:971 (+),score=102.36 gb/GECG01014387.1/:1-2913(+)
MIIDSIEYYIMTKAWGRITVQRGMSYLRRAPIPRRHRVGGHPLVPVILHYRSFHARWTHVCTPGKLGAVVYWKPMVQGQRGVHSASAGSKLSPEEASHLRQELKTLMKKSLPRSHDAKKQSSSLGRNKTSGGANSFSEIVTRLLLDRYALDQEVIQLAMEQKLEAKKPLQAFRWFVDGCEEGTWVSLTKIHALMDALHQENCMTELYVVAVHVLQRYALILIQDPVHDYLRLRRASDSNNTALPVNDDDGDKRRNRKGTPRSSGNRQAANSKYFMIPKEIWSQFSQKTAAQRKGYEDGILSYDDLINRRQEIHHEESLPVDRVAISPELLHYCYYAFSYDGNQLGIETLHKLVSACISHIGETYTLEIPLATDGRTPRRTTDVTIGSEHSEWLQLQLKTLLDTGDIMKAVSQYQALRKHDVVPKWSVVEKLIEQLAGELQQPELAYEVLQEFEQHTISEQHAGSDQYARAMDSIVEGFLKTNELAEAQKVYDSFVKRYHRQVPSVVSKMIKSFAETSWWDNAVSLYMGAIQGAPLSGQMVESYPILLDQLARRGQSGLIVRLWTMFKRSLDSYVASSQRGKSPEATIIRLKSLTLHSLSRACQNSRPLPDDTFESFKQFQSVNYVPYRWRVARPVPGRRSQPSLLPVSSILRSAIILDPSTVSTSWVRDVLAESFAGGLPEETLDTVIMLLRCFPKEDVIGAINSAEETFAQTRNEHVPPIQGGIMPSLTGVIHSLANDGFIGYCGILVADIGSEVVSALPRETGNELQSFWIQLFQSILHGTLLTPSEIQGFGIGDEHSKRRFALHLYSLAWEATVCQKLGLSQYANGSPNGCIVTSELITATVDRLLELSQTAECLSGLLEFLCCTTVLGYQLPNETKDTILRKVNEGGYLRRTSSSLDRRKYPMIGSLLSESAIDMSRYFKAADLVKYVSDMEESTSSKDGQLTTDQATFILNALDELAGALRKANG